jgi:hypothetical protein
VSIAISGPSANGGTSSIRSPLQNFPGVVPAGRAPGGRQAHLLVGRGGLQVVERHHHPDVVDRAVAHGPDRPVGQRAAAEQPDVARAGGGDRVVEAGHAGTLRTTMRTRWKLLGLAGVAGVAATGAVVAHQRRQQVEYSPEELRERLHQRLANASPDGEGPEAQTGGEASGPVRKYGA